MRCQLVLKAFTLWDTDKIWTPSKQMRFSSNNGFNKGKMMEDLRQVKAMGKERTHTQIFNMWAETYLQNMCQGNLA